MAIRTPLFTDPTDLGGIEGANNLKEFNSTQIDWLIYQVLMAWAGNPAVSLSTVGSGGTFLPGGMQDTRLQAGAGNTHISSFVPQGSCDPVSDVTVNYETMNMSVATIGGVADTNNLRYPVYYDDGLDKILLEDVNDYVLMEDGDIVKLEEDSYPALQAMSQQDMLDTFIYPAIDKLTAATTTDEQQGTYFISTVSTSIAGSTIVSATPIFRNTLSDTAAYLAADIPEAQDQPDPASVDYFLWRIDQTGTPPAGSEIPVYAVDLAPGFVDIQDYDSGDWETILSELVRWCAVNDTNGYKITYAINPVSGGVARGSTMINTKLDSSSYNTLQVGPDDYRAQIFPAGTETTIGDYTLKIIKF
tara:strand:- start:11663 stop:12742 length:1080 start_codon:yes stop_codon:yes gene_type:complete